MKINLILNSLESMVKASMVRRPVAIRSVPHLIYGSYLLFSLLARQFFLVVPLVIFLILLFIKRNSDIFLSMDSQIKESELEIHAKWVLNTFVFTMFAFSATVLAANFDQYEVMLTIMTTNYLWISYRILYGWCCLYKKTAPVEIFYKVIKGCVALTKKSFNKKTLQGDLL